MNISAFSEHRVSLQLSIFRENKLDFKGEQQWQQKEKS